MSLYEMSPYDDSIEQMAAYAQSRLRLAAHPPFYSAGSCPLQDPAGHPYDWNRVCDPGWWLTGAIVDAGGRVLGSGVLLADDVALTAARVLQDQDATALRFAWSYEAWEGRPEWSSPVADVRTARSGVRYSDPTDLEILTRLESSDIALLRLGEPIPRQPAAWVALGAAPDATQVSYLARHPDARCRSSEPDGCLGAFADAVLCSYYDRTHEYVTPVQFRAVAGSVLVAFLDYQPGAENPAAGRAYDPARDVGAPVIWPGSSLRSEVVGVVSGALAVRGAGTYYRITRVDRWSTWMRGVFAEWHPGSAPLPMPRAPGPPSGAVARSLRRRGSIVGAGLVLSLGASGLLLLGR